MTKYEWERELKNNLKRVPETEVLRILDYYNELFADKAEEGLNEKEIIRRFGNPFDVAYKILYDYRGVIGSADTGTEVPTPQIPQRPSSSAEQSAARKSSGGGGWLAAKLIFFLPYSIVMIVMWSLVVSFAAAGFGSVGAGIVTAFYGFTYLASSVGSVAAVCGAGLAAFGVGCFMSIFAFAIVKAAVKITQKYFFMGKHKTKRVESSSL